MTQSNRKQLGTFLILGLIAAWAVLGTWIYMSLLTAAAWWLLIGYFAVVGMGWFFPASWIIRWMAKPDA